MTYFRFSVFSLVYFFSQMLNAQNNDIKIAFIADVHFADVYPSELNHIENLPKNQSGQTILIRSMESQLHSTRLFNENYMAFHAALYDAVVNKGIKIIAMPGDFSDDGQPLHIKKLNKILSDYADNYDVQFFMINGNHDPTRPYGKLGGKSDFLGRNGKLQPIMSEDKLYHADSKFENPTLISESLKEWGYDGIIEELKDHGFFPKENYLYWETPFSNYNYKNYKFEFASEASQLSNRTFNFKSGGKSLPDVSYLVEPVEGIWLLALDANVYLPKKNGYGFHGAGIGYNHVLEYKHYLIKWTEKVVKEAKKLDKTLIAFSHYPMLDFNDGASNEMKELFGNDKFQAHRIPHENVGKTFADLGLKIHVGGHMHLNDTGVFKTADGNTLYNIQTPSLAAYMPAYKIMTIENNTNRIKIETKILDNVIDYNSFFDWYEIEHSFLKSNFSNRLWDKTILETNSYLDFTSMHIKELIRLRLLKEWPATLKNQLLNKSGWELLIESNSNQKTKNSMSEVNSRVLKSMKDYELSKSDFTNWNGEDLILDFYKLRNADQLVFNESNKKRFEAYKFLFNLLLQSKDEQMNEFKLFAKIFQKQMKGEPAVNFHIDY